MKNQARKSFNLRMLVASDLRKKGYEVYPLPDSPIRIQPHLVAYKDCSFFNIYIYESEEERDEIFSSGLKDEIVEYASVMNAHILTAVVKLTRIKHM